MIKTSFILAERAAYLELQKQVIRGINVGLYVILDPDFIRVVTLNEAENEISISNFDYNIVALQEITKLIDQRLREQQQRWQPMLDKLIAGLTSFEDDERYNLACTFDVDRATLRDRLDQTVAEFSYSADGWRDCAKYVARSLLVPEKELAKKKAPATDMTTALREMAVQRIAERERQTVCQTETLHAKILEVHQACDEVVLHQAAERYQLVTNSKASLEDIVEELIRNEVTNLIEEMFPPR